METATQAPRRGRPPRQPVETFTAQEIEVADDMRSGLAAVGHGADRPDARPAMREAMRASSVEEDPRDRAARRAEELRGHMSGNEDVTDDFYIDPADIPPGWTYEWKRRTLMGAEDPAYQVALARGGWEAVPTSRHPSYMPAGGAYPVIERKGMILMERPLEITHDVRQRDLRIARSQVRQKEAQLNSAEAGHFERQNKDQSLVKVGKSYEPIAIPD